MGETMYGIILDLVFISIICFMGVRILYLKSRIEGCKQYNRMLIGKIEECVEHLEGYEHGG